MEEMMSEKQADFYVAPGGDDANPGTADGPFSTLERARDAVRELMNDNKGKKDFRVLFRGGTYRFSKTTVFSLEDSANTGGTVTYCAYPGERPVFSGGAPLTGWQRLEDEPSLLAAASHLPEFAKGHIWVADAPDSLTEQGDPKELCLSALFIGEKRLPRARGKSFAPQQVTVDTPEEDGNDSIIIPASAIENWPDLSSAEVLVIPTRSWTMNILPLLSVDKGLARTSVPHTYPMRPTSAAKSIVRHAAVWVENTLAVLDSPGEWILDKVTRKIYYWPQDGAPGDDVIASLVAELIKVEGEIDYEGPVDEPVRGLRFRGITFAHTNRYPWHGTTGWGVQHDWEAFDRPTAMLRFRGAEDCVVEECRFVGGAGTAIRLDLHCQNNRIRNNLIADIGGCGVLLCGYGPGTKYANKSNEVTNNHIHHVGRITWHSPAVFAWQSGENRIAHNHLHHTPYTAVVVSGRTIWDREGKMECSRTVRWHEVGTVVGPDYSQQEWHQAWLPDWRRREPLYHGRGNIVEYNDIHDVMETLGDGNGIYISGAGDGNIVRHNCVHDSPSDLMYEAIRCDDDQHGTSIHGNLIYGLGGAAIGIANKGINDITGNIVACPLSPKTLRAMITLEQGPLYGVRVQNNIIYATNKAHALVYQGPRLHGEGPIGRLRDCETDNNVYWCEDDPARCAQHLKNERQYGIEAHSRAADPLFVDAKGGNFHLKPDSPALEMGFTAIDIDSIGLTDEYPGDIS